MMVGDADFFLQSWPYATLYLLSATTAHRIYLWSRVLCLRGFVSGPTQQRRVPRHGVRHVSNVCERGRQQREPALPTCPCKHRKGQGCPARSLMGVHRTHTHMGGDSQAAEDLQADPDVMWYNNQPGIHAPLHTRRIFF